LVSYLMLVVLVLCEGKPKQQPEAADKESCSNITDIVQTQQHSAEADEADKNSCPIDHLEALLCRHKVPGNDIGDETIYRHCARCMTAGK